MVSKNKNWGGGGAGGGGGYWEKGCYFRLEMGPDSAPRDGQKIPCNKSFILKM